MSLKAKLKQCDGECGNPQSYIWKQDSGKRYCKNCWYKIKPAVPLKQSIVVKTQKPIAKQSDKRKKENALYLIANKQFLKDHPTCMMNIPGVCSNQVSCEVHHTFSGKDREKYFLDQTTWLATERNCHDWVHSNPIEARELGYLK